MCERMGERIGGEFDNGESNTQCFDCVSSSLDYVRALCELTVQYNMGSTPFVMCGKISVYQQENFLCTYATPESGGKHLDFLYLLQPPLETLLPDSIEPWGKNITFDFDFPQEISLKTSCRWRR